MRIATWNMNALSRGGHHASTWEWLLTSHRPDVVLAQEAVKPDSLAGCGTLIGHPGSGYAWGSWVVAPNVGVDIEAVPQTTLGNYISPPAIADSHPGCVAVANLVSPIGERFVAISMYGLMDNTGDGRTRHATTSLHRMLSDLMPIFEGNLPIVLGGDLNVTNQPMKGDSGGWWHAQHLNLFERLDALGLVSVTDLDDFDRGDGAVGCTCGLGDACRHVRTIRHGNHAESTPYQDDWFFVSKSIVDRVTTGRAVHDEAAWQRSDHCPLILEIDL